MLSNTHFDNSSSSRDSFKAYIWVCPQSYVSFIKRESARRENDLASAYSNLEATYVSYLTDANIVAWLQAGT